MKERPLIFERFPGLEGKIPWLCLGEFPTPVQKLNKLGAELGLEKFYCKRDDLSNPEYGGNKVRKLEFLLADAKLLNRKSVMTVGAWGSNHILATTIFSRKVGLKTIGVMVPQCSQEYARKNLLLNFALGCEIYFANGMLSAVARGGKIYLQKWLREGRPYFIWAGGTNKLGILGYVNAGLEIAEQVKQGLLPKPDDIFCAAGSCGTFAGLVLGIKLAGLNTRVIGVRVYDRVMVNSFAVLRLARGSLRLMQRTDPAVPNLELSTRDFPVLHEYVGDGYSIPTDAGLEAMRLAWELEGLVLDSTYTGKCLSGIISLARKGELKGRVVVFLNSFNSKPVEKLVEKLPDWKELPREFHHCFEGLQGRGK